MCRMNDVAARRQFDRRLFLITAVAFPITILVGFGPTYYARGLVAASLPSLLVHVHGLMMTLWVGLFVVQVALISAKRVRLHQRLGYAAIGLAVLIIATGLPTALRAAKYGSASTPPGIPPLSFVVVPIFDLVMFALLFGAAIYYRRLPAAHKSLMFLTALNFLPPALSRIQIPTLQAIGPLWFFGAPSVAALACVAIERRRHGRLNTVFLVASLCLIASYVVRLALMSTGPWMRFSEWATSFV
jgi:hypothetical protein